ncbi:MAG: phage tail protein [Clostridia bacterium]|nr:phage tail protein [Clostridia bacterium]
MIKFYDSSGQAHALNGYENHKVKHVLDGCDEMSFTLDTHSEQYQKLYEEARIVSCGNEWLVKKIDDDRIDCVLNFDFLKTTVYKNYASETRLLQEVLESHLPNGWTISGASVSTIRRTITFDYATDFDIIYRCMNVYDVYFVWDIPNKVLTVYKPELMQPTGEYVTSELNLKSLSFKGETTGFATRLYAYGKDGLTMEDAEIEGEPYGLQYVENRSYCDKTVCAYWDDERYTDADSLYEAALDKLTNLSNPVRSYECKVIDLAKMSSDYSFLDFKMHKKVTLIDVDRGIRVEHQIVEYIEYPDDSSNNVVTLSCVPETITTAMQSVVSTMEDTTDYIMTDFESRIAMATAMLTGAFGGYVFTNGSEIFIMDNEDPAQAVIVWRWNINGFGKSSTGIDGPYTTALTFDDTFITNVINAMVIRGSLIEADSIQAGSISQSYTDDVLEQSFTAAEGLVEYMAQQINEYLTNPNGDGALDVINTTIADIQATIDGLLVSVSNAYSGGINYVRNSSGLNGLSDDWSYTGTVITLQNNDTKVSTVANSCFRLSSGATLEQTVDSLIVGTSYTVSVKVKKSASNLGTIALTFNGGSQVYLYSSNTMNEWQEYTATLLNVTASTLTISIAMSGNYMFVADLMVCEGTVAKAWTPAPYEIYTTYTKIDENGVQVWRSDSSERTVMTNAEFAGYYNEEEIFSLNKDETRIGKAVVNGELTVGNAKFIPSDDGMNITILD